MNGSLHRTGDSLLFHCGSRGRASVEHRGLADRRGRPLREQSTARTRPAPASPARRMASSEAHQGRCRGMRATRYARMNARRAARGGPAAECLSIAVEVHHVGFHVAGDIARPLRARVKSRPSGSVHSRSKSVRLQLLTPLISARPASCSERGAGPNVTRTTS